MKARRFGQAHAQACKFPTGAAKSQALAAFMQKHGDDLPASAIKKATATDQLGKWETICDATGIVGAMRYENSDWYLCTVKNAAIRPDMRGKGLGSKLYAATALRARNNPSCLVLAADVTHDNIPSMKALTRIGFRTVNRFCWGRGQKPAHVLHFVQMPPQGKTCP